MVSKLKLNKDTILKVMFIYYIIKIMLTILRNLLLY